MIRRFVHAGAAALMLGFTPALAHAQDPGGDSGDATYAYIGVGLLAAGIMFIICKSARRSA